MGITEAILRTVKDLSPKPLELMSRVRRTATTTSSSPIDCIRRKINGLSTQGAITFDRTTACYRVGPTFGRHMRKYQTKESSR